MMGRNDVVTKINGSLNEQEVITKTSTQKNTLKESRVKDYQHNNVRNLYKGEMDIIVEGFDNI